jgi:Ca2+/Na+ antiporter
LTDDATRATVMASDVNVTGIVFGAIFGGIFIMTCIISAVKAVRWVVYLYQSTVLFS